ncbi:hypothetical protein O0235_02665 [Tepidiforma flava]|uniref:Uncharacterized protein n=1 Tax=Tepidiforma flava TaxID=3004094 RepID=A0ABY7M7H6_9CHLR|nr:hypothetical protein [Tepidiforma flava]WBL36486.1 hypothetical protein O0235_02665 [Tepidiforma flava]
MDFVVLVLGEEGAAAELEDDLIDPGGAEVVAGVLDEADALGGLEFGEAEGAGAVRVARPVARVGFDLLAVDDEGDGVGEFEDEVVGGFDEVDLEGALIDDFDAGDGGCAALEAVFEADNVAEVGDDGGGGVGGVGGALDGILHVFGGDAALIAGMEDDVVAEAEGVGAAAVGDFPVLGDVADDLEVGVEGDEAAEDFDDVFAGGDIDDLDGVEDGVGLGARDDEGVALADAAGGCAGAVFGAAAGRRGAIIAAAPGEGDDEDDADGEDEECDDAHHEGEHAVRH